MEEQQGFVYTQEGTDCGNPYKNALQISKYFTFILEIQFPFRFPCCFLRGTLEITWERVEYDGDPGPLEDVCKTKCFINLLCKPYFQISFLTQCGILLYRYWWNTSVFPFTKKSYLHRAQWRYYIYLSRVRILVSPSWLLTWLAKIFLFIRILTFWNRKYRYFCLYFSFITLYPSFITFFWQTFCDRWPL